MTKKPYNKQRTVMVQKNLSKTEPGLKQTCLDQDISRNLRTYSENQCKINYNNRYI
jgi:hypothetical protein